MKIVIVYIFPPHDGDVHWDYAGRFLMSYQLNPPGLEHESVVIVNGGRPNSQLACMFSPLDDCQLLEHDDSGYDIGGFQKAARTVPADLMVFFGGSAYFTRPGWLARMVQAFERHGNAQYGAMGNRGDARVGVWPHIRTTGFWMKPELMNSYPRQIIHPSQRHPFEHGPECLTSWLTRHGIGSWVVTWTRELEQHRWDDDPNGYQRGNQSSLLVGDRMTEAPYYPSPFQ